MVASSNRAQLAAAERLLDGKLSQAVRYIREELLDVLSLVEAGLDFSEQEDMEFISKQDALEAVKKIGRGLKTLLANRIRCEELVELPPVALAGPSNAGKSMLLNALLGGERSIVSQTKNTTRDVLTGVLKLEKFDCLLFDCAGLATLTGNMADRQSKDNIATSPGNRNATAAEGKAAVVTTSPGNQAAGSQSIIDELFPLPPLTLYSPMTLLYCPSTLCRLYSPLV